MKNFYTEKNIKNTFEIFLQYVYNISEYVKI